MAEPLDYSFITVATVVSQLRVGQIRTEAELHEYILAAVRTEGFTSVHEAMLAPGCRIDILVDETIGIEVKKGKPNAAAVRAQIERYCATGKLRGLILVVERLAAGIPSIGKCRRPDGREIPVHYIALSKRWGVAL
jgi:hypothetical protein